MTIPRRILIALALLLVLPAGLHAQVDVHQPLIPPVPLDPLDFPDAPSPADLEARIYMLPDGNRVEWYRLQGWVPISSRVAFGGGVSYAGVEQQESMQFGGGPAWVALTTKLGPHGLWGLAIDLDAVLPIGDEELYPVSSDAASFGIRVRLSAGRFLGGRSWVGWYTRRVSVPTNQVPENPEDPTTVRPESDWPSGSGLLVAWQAYQESWDGAFYARYDYAGLPESFWIEGDGTWYLARDIGVRAGASVALGPTANRPMDWGVLVGLRWRPGRLDDGGK